MIFLFRQLLVVTLLLFAGHLSAQTISGELRQWHNITLTFDGPGTSETSTPNPFMDYALEVTFTNGSTQYTVPGYFAADGNAAETSATAGNKWRVHFAPDLTGTWSYAVSFKTGTDVAVDGGGSSAGFMDGQTGSFTVAVTDKTGRDHRGKGRLRYVGEHYLQHAGTGEWFVKAGADAPENTLAYEDFDAVPNVGNRRKNWQPHAIDYLAAEAAPFTWQNGKGSELLGVINYLASKNVNAFSFLTFNVEGDDKNVFPHLYTGDVDDYNGSNSWSNDSDLQHDRFDVSRLAQWERIFEYADQKGIYLHFKTQETENDDLMDGGALGRERKAYYRELIARFSHHLALNWNMGEENTQTTQERIDMADYFDEVDPYDHLRVLHTYPGQKNTVYTPLLGSLSAYTGLSLQTSNPNQQQAFSDTKIWVDKSRIVDKKWVVAVDEPGNASIGVDSDPDDRKLTRHRVVWGNFMAGGAGTEFYYGYQSGCGDLECQDHRSRDQKYTDAAFALQFFQTHFQPFLPNVANDNGLTTDGNDYVLAKAGNAYAVYRPNGGSTSISLPAGSWQLRWYNPRNGNMGAPMIISGNTLTAPDNNDWTALILPADCSTGNACNDNDDCTTNDQLDEHCNCAGTAEDADNDGVCDALDNCPDLDDNLIGTSCDDGDPDTDNDRYRNDCSCAGTPPNQVTDFWLEAECGEYGDVWQIRDGDGIGASNDTFLQPFAGDICLNEPPTDEHFFLRFRVAVPATAYYVIYARTYTSNDGDDSFWVRSGCGDWNRWNKINFPYPNNGLEWSMVGHWTEGDSYEPSVFYLEKGVNLIEFVYRESGPMLDKIYITLDGDTPFGEGAPAGNCNPVCTPGASCDDNDPLTFNDSYDDLCNCAGATVNCAVLPVRWANFEAVKEGNNVRLTWSTLGEINNRDFKVANLSDRSRIILATLPAQSGNTTASRQYEFVHRDPGPGRHIYQIIQTDHDGSESRSPLRSVFFADEAPSIYPNPSSGIVTIRGLEENTLVQVFDVRGQQQISGFSTGSQLVLDLSHLSPGVYLCKIGEKVMRIIRN